jgi:hypothetical protein
MDDATSERRNCTVCGRPLYRNNQTGICTGDGSTPACRSAYLKGRKRKSRVVPDSEREACTICGGKLRADNKVGICRRTLACREAIAARRWQQGTASRPGRSHPRRAPVIPVGTAFGRWTTLEVNPQGRQSKTLCRCTCGTEKRVETYALRVGLSRSCGCLRHENKGRARSDGAPYLPAGSVSGWLTTLEEAANSRVPVRVRCECGTEAVKNAQRLKAGKVRSCGCMPRQTLRTHGLSGHPLYNIWRSIVRRASKPTDKAYKNYGRIGRTICAGWMSMPDGLLSFAADMGERPAGLTTDRVINTGGYWCGHCEECVRLGRTGNCRWATSEEQGANRTSPEGLISVTRERDELAVRVTELEAEVTLLRTMLADEHGTLL